MIPGRLLQLMRGLEPVEGMARRVISLGRGIADERRGRPPKVNFSDRCGDRTIYYLTPDHNEPAGGILVMYRHVDLLNASGHTAAVLHQRPGFRCTWFDNETRITDVRTTAVAPGDLLVIPEVMSTLLPILPRGVRHVVFNQGPYLTWRRAPDQVAAHYRRSTSLAGVMTVSEHATDLLEYAYPNLKIWRVHLAVDDRMFHPGSDARQRLICYTPRRGGDDAKIVLRLLRDRGVLDGWAVQVLDGLRQADFAERLRSSSIFLNFGCQEGFGLPPAEAMACGNYVVGFDGFAGREFFRPEFSRPVPTRDVLGMARAVEDVLRTETTEPGWCAKRGLEASRFVLSEYSSSRERRDVLRCYEQLGSAEA